MIKHLFINHSLMKEKGFWGFGVLQDDPQETGGGAAAGLPAGGVPAQALSAMAIGKKVKEGKLPYHHQTSDVDSR